MSSITSNPLPVISREIPPSEQVIFKKPSRASRIWSGLSVLPSFAVGAAKMVGLALCYATIVPVLARWAWRVYTKDPIYRKADKEFKVKFQSVLSTITLRLQNLSNPLNFRAPSPDSASGHQITNPSDIERELYICTQVAREYLVCAQKQPTSTQLDRLNKANLKCLHKLNESKIGRSSPNFMYHNENAKAIKAVRKNFSRFIINVQHPANRKEKKEIKQAYETGRLRLSAVNSPHEMTAALNFDGVHVLETAKEASQFWNVPLAFLEMRINELNRDSKCEQAQRYQESLKLYESLKEKSESGFRGSSLKEDPLMQFLPVNAHIQQVTEGHDVLSTTLRSGAMAAHGNVNPEDRADILFSQALTLVTESIMLKSDEELTQIQASGQFLFMATSLLSTWKKEKTMIKDMQWAMRQLSRVQFKFDGNDHEPSIEKEGRKIVISLRGNNSTPISIASVFYTHGVNQDQSFAQLTGGDRLQYEINAENWKLHCDYYNKIVDPTDDLVTLKTQIDLCFQNPKTKNIELLSLLTEFTRLMNGGTLVCCKSGKDRTAMKVTYDEARRIVNKHPELSQDEVTAGLRSNGVNLPICGKNATVKTYTFNEFQLGILPKEYLPPSQRTHLLEEVSPQS